MPAIFINPEILNSIEYFIIRLLLIILLLIAAYKLIKNELSETHPKKKNGSSKRVSRKTQVKDP